MSARSSTAFTGHRSTAPPRSRGNLKARVENLLLWFLQLALAVVFLGAGGAKLVDNPEMVTMFDHISFGQWLRYLTGTLEVSGAVLLLVPRLPGVGAGLLLPVLAGAIVTHSLLLQDGGALPPTILFGLLAVVAWRRWGTLREALRSLKEATP